MNLIQAIIDSAKYEQEYLSLHRSIDVSYYCAFGLVVIMMLAIIVNHVKLKKLFTDSLIPYYAMFVMHPAWFSALVSVQIFYINGYVREIWSYAYLALAIIYFFIFLMITNKRAKTEKAKAADES